MKKIIPVLIIFILIGLNIQAQFSRYIIHLKDKATSTFSISNPAQFLTQRAITRRSKYTISIDETDLPIPQAYLDSISSVSNVTILNVSKWLNQVCIQTSDAAALNKINTFSFVATSAPIAARLGGAISIINKEIIKSERGISTKDNQKVQGSSSYYSYGQSYPQILLNNIDFLHNHGFRGEGMQLSIMDAGFYHYLSLPTFDSTRNNNQILGTWDFVANKASDLNEDYYHGMECFSTIAANMPGTFVGAAPKTSFYLFRTEDVSSEYPVEEQNWAAAAERADSLGADVFSVSLGYTTFDSSRFNHTYADMNGSTTLIAKAANLAAKKGIIVVVAAGNEGGNSWHYITTPADADSVLAVGAVDVNGLAASFSSYGPNSNGQIKPDVAAVGSNAVIANQNTGAPAYGSGTSYACPIMAGLVTCLWQAFPEVNNMSIIDALRKSGNQYIVPDSRTGYGIADSKKAFVLLIKKLYKQQITIDNSCKATIALTVKTASDMTVFIERKLPTDADYSTIATKNISQSFAATNINFSDNLTVLPINTLIKYRIKMSIATDTTFYLDSTTVTTSLQPCVSTIEAITISPNPVANDLSVLITRNKLVNVAIEVYAANGQKIYRILNQSVNGSQQFTIPMKAHPKGVYFVTVFIDNKKVVTRKVIR